MVVIEIFLLVLTLLSSLKLRMSLSWLFIVTILITSSSYNKNLQNTHVSLNLKMLHIPKHKIQNKTIKVFESIDMVFLLHKSTS